MKQVKTADYIIQWVLIAAGLFLSLALLNTSSGVSFIYAYFIVGGWQILSVFVHFILPPVAKGRQRKVYLWCLVVVMAFGFLAYVADDFSIMYLFGLLFVSPFLAVYYAIICMNETKALEPPPQISE